MSEKPLTPSETVHDLKTWPDYFDAILRGTKTFEVRREVDRYFHIGDTLRLREWHPNSETYTGRSIDVAVTYIFRGAAAFLAEFPPRVAVLGIRPIGQPMGQPLPSPYWEQKAKHYASALERIAMTKGLPIEVYEVAADALCWARKHRTEHLDDSIGELADGLTNTTSQILLGEARSSLTRLRRYALTESDKMDVDYLSLALDHLEEHMGTRIPKDYEPAAIDYLERLGVDPATGLKPLMRLIADVACSVGVKK